MTFWSELAAGDSAPQFLDGDARHLGQRNSLVEAHALVGVHAEEVALELCLSVGRGEKCLYHVHEGIESLADRHFHDSMLTDPLSNGQAALFAI